MRNKNNVIGPKKRLETSSIEEVCFILFEEIKEIDWILNP